MADAMTFIAALASAAIVATVATVPAAAIARRWGLVVAPRPDRWHRRPTPLLGGAAMALATLTSVVVLVGDLRVAVVVALCGGAAFALGLLDDFRHLPPTTKLVGQVLLATGLVVGGIKVGITAIPPVDFVLTVFWVVGIMNAVNLIDNMDGLAAGIAGIAGTALALTAWGDYPAAVVVGAAAAGSAFGFLVHNFHPARVFMGDAGSHLLGFLLASAALLHTASGAVDVSLAVLAPLAVLALPIFDTALVTASRSLAGQPIGRGGKDHVSHRLAALGLSDRGAVLMLYGVAVALAGVGLIAQLAALVFLPVLALAVIGLVLFGSFLLEVDVYGRESVSPPSDPSVRHALYTYGRFGLEVAMDVVLLTTAYFASHLLRFEATPQISWLPIFASSLPLVVGSQLGALVLTGVYRTLWRYLGLSDAIQIMRATALGTGAAALLLLFALRFEGHSRAVFLLDWLIATVLLVGSRAFLLWLQHWFAARPRAGQRRALIVGATDSGAVAVRLLGRLAAGSCRAVGFLDDDPGMRNRRIAGVPIVGRMSGLQEAVRRLNVDLVVLALDGTDPELVAALKRSCEAIGVEYREFLVSRLQPRMVEGT